MTADDPHIRRECGHRVIAPERLPCPHPECWKPGPVLHVPRRQAEAHASFIEEAPPPQPLHMAEDVYDRHEVTPDVWAWLLRES